MKIITSTEPAKEAAQQLSEFLSELKNTPVLLLLSGGSALSVLDYLPTDDWGGNVTITTVDERFSTDPKINNFAQIKETDFYRRAIAQGVKSIDTSVNEDDDLINAGKRFEQALRDWRGNNPSGEVLAVLGVGPDGHTAGIFQEAKEIMKNNKSWVLAYKIKETTNPYTKRITITDEFLTSQVDKAVVYATGENKRSVIVRLESDSCDKEEVPACVIREMKAVTLVADK